MVGWGSGSKARAFHHAGCSECCSLASEWEGVHLSEEVPLHPTPERSHLAGVEPEQHDARSKPDSSGKQSRKLSKDRVSSTIPIAKGTGLPTQRGATGTCVSQRTDVSPSRRRLGPEEGDMSNVILSTMRSTNGAGRGARRERLHAGEDCPGCKLVGVKQHYSPKARFSTFLGSNPFDRHDLIVDRCGVDVRYVIDFYNGEISGPALADCHAPGRSAGWTFL